MCCLMYRNILNIINIGVKIQKYNINPIKINNKILKKSKHQILEQV